MLELVLLLDCYIVSWTVTCAVTRPVPQMASFSSLERMAARSFPPQPRENMGKHVPSELHTMCKNIIIHEKNPNEQRINCRTSYDHVKGSIYLLWHSSLERFCRAQKH